MAWFWGSKKGDEEEESDEYTDDDEYTDEEYTDEEGDYTDDGEDYDDEEDETSYTDEEKEEESAKERTEEGLSEPAIAPLESPAGMNPLSSPPTPAQIQRGSLDDDDDEYTESSEEDDDDSDLSSSEEEEEPASTSTSAKTENVIRVETVGEGETDEESTGPPQPIAANRTSSTKPTPGPSTDDEEEEDEEEDGPTSFWEKQSLLLLAAEHDRVDILKAILSEDDPDKATLMDSGIPPLHISISFGSTNATQSLLRMGADPSVRPDLQQVQKQQAEAPEGSKLELPNPSRFDGISAWELAFGNEAYQQQQSEGRWSSVFASPPPSVKVIAPCQMPPSKREGIRHAFTAEALRCIGADEVHRLEQLLASGMPASVEIGGKDLYDWAVQLGGLQCEEFLRPSEAAKHGGEPPSGESPPTKVSSPQEGPPSASSSSSGGGKILDRPGDRTTVPQLANRLDELESLATALSSCLDNLAEEVSVCHGLLLLGGGASALAAHVKSLKELQEQKQNQLFQAHEEWKAAEDELEDLIQSSGRIGREVSELTPSTLAGGLSQTDSFRFGGETDVEKQQQLLLAQIAASEAKIRKLRASIADLSEENAREMEEVEKRGLSGGIKLVRGLRDEIRDIEFALTEAKNGNATCRAKIQMIHARLPAAQTPPVEQATETQAPTVAGESTTTTASLQEATTAAAESNGAVVVDYDPESKEPTFHSETESLKAALALELIDDDSAGSDTKVKAPLPPQALPGTAKRPALRRAIESPVTTPTKTPSEKVATGDSKAIVVRPSGGNRGYFTVDLWQVLLRIIGFDNAATRRAAYAAQNKGSTASLMIV